MSFTETPAADVTAETDPSFGATEQAPTTEAAPQAEAPAPSYLDLDAYGNHIVKAKVDGEEIEVPIADAIQGYQRQADYTRKSQELAEQRKNLELAETFWGALEADPAATIQILQEQFLAEQGQPTQAATQAPVDPLQARLEQLELAEATRMIEAEFNQLRSQYGEFPEDQVAQLAATRNIPITDAFMLYQGQQSLAQQQAAAQVQAEKQQEEAARAAAKEAAGFISGGSSANPAATQPVTTINSFEDAFEAAARQVGWPA